MLTKTILETISNSLCAYDSCMNNKHVSDILKPIIYNVNMEAKQSDEQRIQDAERVLRADYFSHVRGIALEIFENIADRTIECREGLDNWIHETIDSSAWTFETHSAMKVLLFSNNDGVCVEEFGTDGVFKDGCINWGSMAFSAMKADLLEDVELFNQETDDVFTWIDNDSKREDGEEYEEDENVGRVEKARAAIDEFKRCGYGETETA